MMRRGQCLGARGAFSAAVILLCISTCMAQETDTDTAESSVPVEGETASPKRRITNIEIHGLQRTKESYIMESLGRFKGMEAGDAAAKGVEAMLNAQGLFSEVKAEIADDGDGAKIVATVKEKVSFLPIPIAGGSSDGWMAGFMLMDMNAFGRHDIFTGGFIYGSEMQLGMLSFTKLPKGLLRPGFSAAGGFTNSNDKEFTDFYNNEFAEDDTIGAFGNAVLILPLSRHFSVSAGGNYKYCHFDDGTWDFSHLLMGVGGITWRMGQGGDWFPLESGVSLQGKAGADLGDGANAAQEASLKGHFQFPITGRSRVDIGFNGILQHDVPAPLQTGKGDICSSIVRPNFRSDRYGMSRLLCEVGLVRGKYAMLSLYTSFEAAAARDTDDSFAWCVGPGAGVLLYLNRIIFPAIMGGASYNINQNRVQGSFSVGIGF